MAKNVDIIDVMIAVHRGELKASVSNGYFMLENTKSGERVRLNEADVAPVVHGRWIKNVEMRRTDGHIYDYCCSNCHGFAQKGRYNNYDVFTDYCSKCGAKMDLEVNDA